MIGGLAPLAMVVFDWAGTMVDFGCKAPVQVIARALAEDGVAASEADIRADMGLAKLDHLRSLLAKPAVAQMWNERHGQPVQESDVIRIHDQLESLVVQAIAETSELIPGARAAYETLKSAGLKIASTTGYTRAMMEPVLARAAQQGYRPDLVTCSGETISGRPSPLMMYRSCLELNVWPMQHVVKVDDAPSGIGEGLAAGAWAIGVAASGNAVGLSQAEFQALSDQERTSRVGAGRHMLEAAGAHYVVDSVADILPVLNHIAARLRAGAHP